MSAKASNADCDALAGQHKVNNAPKQKRKPSVLIVVDRTHLCTKDVSLIKMQLLKQQRENKISSTQQ